MSPKPRDYFYYNNSEKKSILALLVILIGLLIYLYSIPAMELKESVNQGKVEAIVKTLDSLSKARELAVQKETEEEDAESALFSFNPNELDQKGWEGLGLTEKQSNTILNYLNKGGKFRIKSDLKKMYSISENKYVELEPYIQLPDSLPKKIFERKKYTIPKKKLIVISINSADSSEFIKLRGIGPTYASRIVKYRTNLGGFHSIDQLSEVYGVTDSLVASFGAQLRLDTINIKKLDINYAEAKELKVNPYIDWNVANSIVNYREQHGLYNKIEDIKSSVLIDDSLFQKLKPYLLIVK